MTITASTAPHADRTTTSTPRRLRLLVGATAGALALTAGLGACGSAAHTAAGSADASRPGLIASSAATIPVAEDAAVVAPVQSGQDTTAGANSSGPVIDTFETPDDIDCHNGDLQDFSVSWTTTDATRVTISIDGPGIYAEYPVDGDTSLPFNCSTSHTFLLTAYGSNGQKATRTVTLEPRNVQSEATGDEDDDLRRVPAGSTAKISGGATGQGSATDAQCADIASSLDGLYDVAAGVHSVPEIEATLEVAAGLQAAGEAVGCFFVGEGM